MSNILQIEYQGRTWEFEYGGDEQEMINTQMEMFDHYRDVNREEHDKLGLDDFIRERLDLQELERMLDMIEEKMIRFNRKKNRPSVTSQIGMGLLLAVGLNKVGTYSKVREHLPKDI